MSERYIMPTPWRDPINAPPGLPLAGPLGQAQDAPGSPQVRIRTRQFTWDGGGTEFVRVVVQEPTLVKVLSFTPDVVVGATAIMGYRLLSDLVGDTTFVSDGLLPFFGPYAYLTVPGEYELGFLLTFSGAIASVTGSLQIATGIPPQAVEALLDAGRCHNLQTSEIVLAAATLSPVPSGAQYNRWPCFKRIRIKVIGANPADLRFGTVATGLTATTGAGIANAIEFFPEECGRATLRAISTLGTTLHVEVALW